MRLIQRHCTAAIVTNESLAARARAAGIREVLVLDDIIEPRPYHGRSGHVVFPVTYANDEPIREILDAARLTPEVQFVLTGRAPDWVKELAPSNVTLPGFVSRAEFEALLEEASVVGALTNRPYTMQRAGYEALELGAPLLTSPTEDLRHYFGECVAYADEKNSAGSIASAIQSLLSESGDYRKKMVQLRRSKLHEQAGRLTTLVSMLAPEVRALP
jgi:glycosyltransferase involved in cell wall biosynthesis